MFPTALGRFCRPIVSCPYRQCSNKKTTTKLLPPFRQTAALWSYRVFSANAHPNQHSCFVSVRALNVYRLLVRVTPLRASLRLYGQHNPIEAASAVIFLLRSSGSQKVRAWQVTLQNARPHASTSVCCQPCFTGNNASIKFTEYICSERQFDVIGKQFSHPEYTHNGKGRRWGDVKQRFSHVRKTFDVNRRRNGINNTATQ